ncbi:MAG: type II toxin-antitoxin system HicA family toxin [Beijerinckiaceae bacterium]
MPSLTTKELDRLLRQHGCLLKADGGKHEKWWSPITNRTFAVPRTLKTEGTLRGVLRDAGIAHPKYG